MEKLDRVYGKASYEEWTTKHPSDLADTKVSPKTAGRDAWNVHSFRKLVEMVAFLGSMNKRLALFYRGQREDRDPLPMLFRDSWRVFDTGERLQITESLRNHYWEELTDIGDEVYDACRATVGLPRRRGLRDIREVQWAVIQHYELWPTPLIDLTSSLRVAASFAMSFTPGTPDAPRTGFLLVVGMPHLIGSIGFDVDRHIVLARLQSCCPATARRPHFQEGFLVGRFPMYEPTERIAEKSSLRRRLIAKFKLVDSGAFWTTDFPIIPQNALIPADDPLLDALKERFGRTAPASIYKRALNITNGRVARIRAG